MKNYIKQHRHLIFALTLFGCTFILLLLGALERKFIWIGITTSIAILPQIMQRAREQKKRIAEIGKLAAKKEEREKPLGLGAYIFIALLVIMTIGEIVKRILG